MKNSFIKVLSFVMALTMIVGCFTAISFSAAECNHTKGEKGTTVPPTCVDPGFTWYTCATCGDQYMDDITAATGVHTEKVDPATDATCTSPAMTAGKICSVCKVTIQAKQPVAGSKALGHNFVIKEAKADCTTANSSYYECTRCNKTAKKASDDEKLTGDDRYDVKYPTTTYGAAIGHAWDYVVVAAPTTCADGQVTVTCKNCKTVKTVTAPAVHQYVAITNTSSCAEYTSGQQCALCGKIKDGVKNEEVTHSWTAVTGMNAAVEALGIKNTSELTKAATCTDAGYKVEKCVNCGLYAKNTVKALGHSETGAWTYAGGESNKNGFCKTEYAKTLKCNRAGCNVVLKTVVIEAAKAHDLKTEVKKPTCTEQGYTFVTCKNGCGYYVENTYKDALGHTWSAWEYTGNCTTGITGTRKCTVEGCTATETTTTPAGQHNMTTGSVVKTVAATCQAKAYYVYYCQNANCAYTEKITGSEFGEKDPANHQNLTKSFTKTAPTCTTTGVDVYLCACGTTIDKTVATTAHVPGTSYSSGGSVKVNVNAVAPNCQTDGKTAGECCTKCGKILKAQEVISKSTLDLSKAASHKDTTPDNHGAAVAATCISDGYQMAYFSCCGYVKTNIQKADASKHVMAEVDYKAPECAKAGNHAYFGCTVKGCGYIASVDTSTCAGCAKDHDVVEATLDATIDALGHDLKDVKIDPETCTENGTTAHKDCARCDYTEGKRTIPAHGDKYKTASAAVAATCTTKGKVAVTAGTLCQVCDAASIETPVKGHNYVGTPVTTNDCTKPTYTVYECANNCGSSYAANFVAGKEAHNYELNWHKVENKNGIIYVDGVATSDYACQKGTYEYRQCVNCTTGIIKQNEKAAISHYYMVDGTTKVEIKLDCKNIAEFDGHTCALCGHKVVADDKKAGTGDITVTHNVKTTSKAPTCTADGYSIEACADCGKVFAQETVKSAGHTVKYMIEEVAATNSKDGYKKFMCSVCNTEVTEVIPAINGIILNVKAAGAAVANNQVKLNVTLSASNYAFNEIQFAIAKDGAQVALADVAVSVDYAFAATDAVTAVASDNGDYIHVLVYVPNGADGKAKNVTVSGTDVAFVTITLDVLATANGGVAVETDEADIADVAYIDNNGKVAYKDNADIKATEFKTSVIGDVNGDSKLDAGDSIVIQSAIYAASYIAEADFDKNGKIDLADHVAFVKFVTSRKSVLDYLAVMGITVEGIVADMKLAYDLDFDRTVGSANDKAVLVAYLNEALSDVYYTEFADNYDGSIVDLINEVAFRLSAGSIRV